MKMRVIGDRLTVNMFHLAGVTGRYVSTSEEALKTLGEFKSEEAIIVIGSSITTNFPEIRKQLELTRQRYLIIELPETTEKSGEEKLEKLVQQTIGIKL